MTKIGDVERCVGGLQNGFPLHGLEAWAKGHSRSLKMVQFRNSVNCSVSICRRLCSNFQCGAVGLQENIGIVKLHDCSHPLLVTKTDASRKQVSQP